MDRTVIEEEEKYEDMFYSPENLQDKDEENTEKYWTDHMEKKKIDHLREIVEKQDPNCKNVDDLTLRRFLRARELDIEKACAMYMKYLAWRRTFVPKGSISVSEIPNQIAHNKVCIQGTDRRGCPVTTIFIDKHFPVKGGIDEFKRFVVFVLDKICSRMPDGQEKFIIIVDLKGWGFSKMDIRAYIAAFSLLQDFYPERLKKMFLVHVPYIFMTAWKIINPFIDKTTKKNIIFVESKKLQHTLLEEIEENEVAEMYGGKLQQQIPIQDA